MSKLFTIGSAAFSWRLVNPWAIIVDLLKYRELIASMTLQNFRSTYQASYLGIAWQIILPLIMLSIFILCLNDLRRTFTQAAIESPLDYALALFVGLAFSILLRKILIISFIDYVSSSVCKKFIVSAGNHFYSQCSHFYVDADY